MDFYTALRTAENYYREHPATVPADQGNPASYRLACAENLAMAIHERSESLARESGMEIGEAGLQAALEVTDLAGQIPEPTASHLADTAKQLAEAAAALAEQDAY